MFNLAHMPGRRKKLVIRKAEQLAAIASPVRARIVQSLSLHGPSSVREIAARLGRVPESLYYHLHHLVEVGIVELKEKRKVRRRMEAMYQLAAPRLVIDPKQRSDEFTDALAGACSAVLRLAERNYRAAVNHGGLTLEGPRRNLMVRHHLLRLDRAGLAQLNRLLDRVAEMYDGPDEVKGNAPYSVTVVLSQLSRPGDNP
jgi:DNA-binding transcriptional ArsR family regulator